MFPRRSSFTWAALAALAACSADRPVSPTAEYVDGVAGAITAASTITAEYDLAVGQTVRIVPRSTSRTNRLRWISSNSSVATVSSQGVVTAVSAGRSTVTVSGSGVLESYAVVAASPTPTLTGFSLQPASTVTLNVGQTRQFTTVQTWSDGLTRTSGVTFSATGGTISSSGLFTAGNLAGTFMVIASCSCGATAIADTTPVVVASVAQLTKLTISPKTISINAGASQQFTVTANWSTGATDAPPVTWSATGGSVSASGAFVAPTSAGTFRVVVAHTNGTARDTAVVTVVGSSAPSNGTPFFSDNFDTGRYNNANGFLWGSATSVSVTTTRAFSGSHALEFTYSATPIGSDASAEQRFDMGRYLSEVWIEYQLYVPANFKHRLDAPTNNKFLMLWRDVYSDVAGGTWRIGAEYTRVNDATSKLRFLSSRWDLNSWTDNGPWPTPEPVNYGTLISSSGPVRPGQWTRMRFHVKAASSRTAEDGQIEIWADNTLVFSYYRGRFHNAFSTPVAAVLRNGYILGWSNSGFDQTTVFHVDDVKFYQSAPAW